MDGRFAFAASAPISGACAGAACAGNSLVPQPGQQWPGFFVRERFTRTPRRIPAGDNWNACRLILRKSLYRVDKCLGRSPYAPENTRRQLSKGTNRRRCSEVNARR